MRDGEYLSRPTVLLDLDETILDFCRAERAAVSDTLRRLGVEPTERVTERYSEINRRHWEMLEEGRLTRRQVLLGRFQQLFRELGAAASPEEAQELYERRLAVGHFFMPGAEDMLRELSAAYRLFICSNGTASVQAGRLESAGINGYFERIFISEDIGFNKPDPRYFEGCFSQIPAFDRERSIMVGDSLSSDIRGGINAGVLTCWFNPRGSEPRADIRPDYEIDALDRLRPLLDRIFA